MVHVAQVKIAGENGRSTAPCVGEIREPHRNLLYADPICICDTPEGDERAGAEGSAANPTAWNFDRRRQDKSVDEPACHGREDKEIQCAEHDGGHTVNEPHKDVVSAKCEQSCRQEAETQNGRAQCEPSLRTGGHGAPKKVECFVDKPMCRKHHGLKNGGDGRNSCVTCFAVACFSFARFNDVLAG